MKNRKIIINRRSIYVHDGVRAAARELGVSPQAIRQFLAGENAISKDKRDRIVVKTVSARH